MNNTIISNVFYVEQEVTVFAKSWPAVTRLHVAVMCGKHSGQANAHIRAAGTGRHTPSGLNFLTDCHTRGGEFESRLARDIFVYGPTEVVSVVSMVHKYVISVISVIECFTT